MKKKKIVLIILIVVLVLFYSYICYDLSNISFDVQTLGKKEMVRVISYSVIWGILLTAISSQIDSRKKVIKAVLKVAGLWCVVIGIIVEIIVLSGITGL